MSIPQGDWPVTPIYVPCVFCISGIELLGDGPCDVCLSSLQMEVPLDLTAVVVTMQRLRARITA